jgi:flagellar assembly protein FliH
LSSGRSIDLGGSPRSVRLVASGERARAAFEERGRASERLRGAEEALSEVAGEVERIVSALEGERAAVQANLARVSVELALVIAREVVRREIRAGNYDLEAIVRESLAEASLAAGPCRVRVSPKDRTALEAVPFRSGTTLVADEGVRRGDVQVETALGMLVRESARLLDAVEQRLLEALH